MAQVWLNFKFECNHMKLNQLDLISYDFFPQVARLSFFTYRTMTLLYKLEIQEKPYGASGLSY